MNNILNILINLIKNNLFIAPIISLIAGILTSFTPCSLSSVPLIIGYLGGTNSKNLKVSFKLSLMFALGSSITFTCLGIMATVFGKVFRLTGNWWYLFLAILLIVMVLQLFEIINIIPSNNLLTKNKTKGIIGAFLAGILAGLFSSPCSTPVLIVLLALVSAKGSFFYGTLLLLFYAIGHSILVVIAGTLVGFVMKIKSYNQYEKINKIVKILFGILILVLALYMFYLGI